MVGSLLDVKKYSQGRGEKNTWVESGLIGVSPWGTTESWGWGSRVQTHKNLEPLLETKAGAAVMISEKLGCLEFRDVGVIFTYLWEYKSLPKMGKGAIIIKS